MSEFNREDAAVAAEIMRELCPVLSDQQVVLGQLLSSIAVAEQVAPQSWAVTLFGNGFRLNVGPVEAFTFFDREVSLFLLGSVPPEAQDPSELTPCSFRSIPQPQHMFCASLERLASVRDLLQPAHAEFVRAAAVTSTGKPRRSPYSRYHSRGLHTYALRVTDGNVGGGV